MRQLKAVPALLASVLISGCGHQLGSYDLNDVKAVRWLPASVPESAQSYGEFIEVRIASPTNLTALSDKPHAVYVDARLCSSGKADELIAFGPFSDNGASLRNPSDAQNIQPDESGHFHYSVFLVPAHPMLGTHYSATAMEWSKYDLRLINDDVCIRLVAPSYTLASTKSQVTRIPSEIIKRVLSRGPP